MSKKEPPIKCHCGLQYPPDDFVNGLCPECQLARILTEHDRPAPDRVEMTFPGRDYGLFSTRGYRREP